jgi:hypothetical protein
MRKVTQGIVLFAGLLAVPSSKDSDLLFAEVVRYQKDPRLEALESFFVTYDCPIRGLASDFLMAADRNELDWRLLPSISFVESGAGKEYGRNNIFGWDNGRQKFNSIRQGIHHVADQLGRSKLYRLKDTDQILRLYNPNTGYATLVKSVMRLIGPEETVPSPVRN